MRKLLLVALGVLALPTLALAQTQDCPSCVLGIFDGPNINNTTNCGTIGVGTPKDVYVGIRLSGTETGVTGLEFSIAGMDGLLLIGTEALTPAALTLGSPPAPADTSATSIGTGGLNMAWATCLSGSQQLIKLSLLSFGPQADKVLKVMHKFPPSNLNFNLKPVFSRCDGPTFTTVRISGGCYVLNPSEPGGVPGCACYSTPVEAKTWGAMKRLYQN